jgi:hypothetical protein
MPRDKPWKLLEVSVPGKLPLQTTLRKSVGETRGTSETETPTEN